LDSFEEFRTIFGHVEARRAEAVGAVVNVPPGRFEAGTPPVPAQEDNLVRAPLPVHRSPPTTGEDDLFVNYDVSDDDGPWQIKQYKNVAICSKVLGNITVLDLVDPPVDTPIVHFLCLFPIVSVMSSVL
jgi:hypothetical protein